ncbi:MAG TPA: hypothetical protein VK577_04720 [Bradyrhizobium sp.]|nr:hypothetical protein [Bradyrhizobium sp.]
MIELKRRSEADRLRCVLQKIVDFPFPYVGGNAAYQMQLMAGGALALAATPAADIPPCPKCHAPYHLEGAERYWEARWRDEKAENDRLRAAANACAQCALTPEMIELPRWWIERACEQLFSFKALPSGQLGDWAFLFREMLKDILDKKKADAATGGCQ